MLKWARNLSLICLFAAASTPAFSQSDEWEFEASFYLFAAETTSGLRGNDVVLGFGDALKNTDFAFMGAFSASHGEWSFVADYTFTDLSFDGPSPSTAFSAEELTVKTQILTGLGLYNVYENQNMKIDVGAGFRWFDTETTLRLAPGLSPEQLLVEDDSWIDPIVAARLRYEFSSRWSAIALLDFGSFVDDRETGQILFTANYALNESWVARFGYRYLRIENDEDGQRYLLEQSGPIVGVSYRF